jgi:hypothetical protein
MHNVLVTGTIDDALIMVLDIFTRKRRTVMEFCIVYEVETDCKLIKTLPALSKLRYPFRTVATAIE